ncbi:carboxypeptidase B precursor, putative [Perkinsus marinus ATCC 50983]|uniref:Carboxypeptidase B, putative n=1 Tax=Perkinsus marinus (strain ATCC 50983 / TXsc) TaxID=423536 RepID=C5LK73_PERM5|nr:carboxypeptidase B precursor, putative [Perkinsus marinus ATCC 50983]EER02860.1 carboxypeptidase B precursor, putative [Perkinsus marinus ATCC 50983]|eukprot:XP_002771044.1 carboxypeptidase B precursor, putative [Perkinsus marinus ATCC 50983]
MARLKALQGKCPGMAIDREQQHGIAMTIVRLGAVGDNVGKAPGEALLVFGEHARELISSEIALQLIQRICDIRSTGAPSGDPHAKAALRAITIVPVVNEAGRSLVMGKGQWCWRGNENGVDLNRNFGGSAHWSSKLRSAEENSGPSQFSEPETKILRSLIDKTSPEFFLSVHSGMLGLFYPYAYSPSAHPSTAGALERVLDRVADEGCQCPSGQASIEIGHGAPGSSLDYAFKDGAGARFAYAVEVYSDPSRRGAFHEEYKERKKDGASPVTYLTSISSGDFGPIDGEKCLEYFNPIAENEYNEVLQTWSTNILEMMQLASEETGTPPILRGISPHKNDHVRVG